jgi:hypothetical protein
VPPGPELLCVAALNMACSAAWNDAVSGEWMFAAAFAPLTWRASRNCTEVGPAMTIPMPDASRSIRCASDSEETLARRLSLRL